jgi:hypothetical protein
MFEIEQRLCSKRNCRAPYDRANYNLTVDYEVHGFPPQLQREWGGVGKVSPIDWAHFIIC